MGNEARGDASAPEQSGDAGAPEQKRRLSPGWRALLFVLISFVLWFVFASLAQIVIKCAPLRCSLADFSSKGAMGNREVAMMLIALLTALWVSSRLFFPAEE